MGIDFPPGGHHIYTAVLQDYCSSAEAGMEHNLSAQLISQLTRQDGSVSLYYEIQVFHQSAEKDIPYRPPYQVYGKGLVQGPPTHGSQQKKVVTTDAILDSVEGSVDVLGFWRGPTSCAAIIA
jgi:hypothetical protein